MTTIPDSVPVLHGVLCEFLATSLLIFAVCSATDRRNATWGDSTAIKIGITVGILVYGAVSFSIFENTFRENLARYAGMSTTYIPIIELRSCSARNF